MRPTRKRIVTLGLAVAFVGLTFAFLLPKIADYRDVWRVVAGLSGSDLGYLAGAVVANLVTFSPAWMVALPGIGFGQAFVMTQASTASTYIAPGGAAPGMAVSFAMLRAWGFRRSAVALAVAVTGIWNQLLIFGMPPVALALMTLVGEDNTALRTFSVVGFGAFAVAVAAITGMFASEGMAREVGDFAGRAVSRVLRAVGRGPVGWSGASLVAFRRDALELLGNRWHALTVASLAGQLTVFLLLWACVRACGVSGGEVSGVDVFASWSIVRVVGSLPLTPGGIGVIELGLTSLLVGFGGNQPEVVAGVLLYRALAVLPTLVLGAAAVAVWKRLDRVVPGEEPEPEPVAGAGAPR